jgi:DNA invertase Pin-like site-specific DNA recombinase
MIYAYTRVSTTEQTTARQLDQLPPHDRLYEDHKSGKDLKRPALQEMLGILQRSDTVVILSIDRLARNTRELLLLCEELLKKGVTLRFVKENLTFVDGFDNPMNKMLLTMLGAVAEFERSLINSRCEEGRKAARAAGKRFGVASKLSTEDIAEIRSKAQSQLFYAKKYDISSRYISKIQKDDFYIKNVKNND